MACNIWWSWWLLLVYVSFGFSLGNLCLDFVHPPPSKRPSVNPEMRDELPSSNEMETGALPRIVFEQRQKSWLEGDKALVQLCGFSWLLIDDLSFLRPSWRARMKWIYWGWNKETSVLVKKSSICSSRFRSLVLKSQYFGCVIKSSHNLYAT